MTGNLLDVNIDVETDGKQFWCAIKVNGVTEKRSPMCDTKEMAEYYQSVAIALALAIKEELN